MTTGTLLISRPDGPGIVAAVSGFLAEHGCNILHADQYSDPDTGMFQQRIAFRLDAGSADHDSWSQAFSTVAAQQSFEWRVAWSDVPKRMAILVSRQDHCLWDLLLRHRSGELPSDVVAVISNHEDAGEIARVFDVPFHHLPVTDDTRNDQESQLLDLLKQESIDLAVLARYMQILTPSFTEQVPCPMINIHHSFLPAFSGAQPYRQARQRGVKFVGATAHYVTAELDAGPIIAQDVIRCTHQDTVDDLTRMGRDVERLVLARAVRWHLEDRILLGGDRAVVFE